MRCGSSTANQVGSAPSPGTSSKTTRSCAEPGLVTVNEVSPWFPPDSPTRSPAPDITHSVVIDAHLDQLGGTGSGTSAVVAAGFSVSTMRRISAIWSAAAGGTRTTKWYGRLAGSSIAKPVTPVE